MLKIIRSKIFVIFFVALLLRIGYVLFFPQIPLTHDAADYDNLALQILNGNGFSLPDGELTAHRPPLYPFILSIFYYLFGHSLLAVRILQSFISASFCFLIYTIAKELTSYKIALLSSALVAIYPAFISYSGLLLSEIFSGFFLLLTIYFLVVSHRKNSLIFYILSGISLGLLVLCRQEMLLFIIIFPFALIFLSHNKNKTKLFSLIATFVAILIILSWTIRNYVQFKAIIPVATGTGTNFWHSSHPADFEDWDETLEHEPVKTLIKNLDLKKVDSQVFLDRIFLKEGLKNIKLHPFIYSKLCLLHFTRFWIGSHSNCFLITKDSFVNVISNKRYGVLAIKLFLLGINLVLVILAAVGFFASRRKLRILSPVILPIVYLAAIHTIFYGATRYQIPIMPLVLIFSAIGIETIVKRLFYVEGI